MCVVDFLRQAGTARSRCLKPSTLQRLRQSILFYYTARRAAGQPCRAIAQNSIESQHGLLVIQWSPSMACWSSAERILIYVLASHPREHENSSVPSLFCWLRACRKPVALVNDSGKSSQSQRPSLGSQNEARIRSSSITPFSGPTVSLKLMAHPLAKNSSSGANRITHDEELQSTPQHISSSAGSKSRSSKSCNNS